MDGFGREIEATHSVVFSAKRIQVFLSHVAIHAFGDGDKAWPNGRLNFAELDGTVILKCADHFEESGVMVS